MPVDIDSLTEAELTDLNHRVVARLKMLRQIRDHNQMLEFRIGDRVSFYTQTGLTVTGMLTKYNRKTVTVITDDGHHWNVSPSLLRRAGGPQRTVTVRPVVEQQAIAPEG